MLVLIALTLLASTVAVVRPEVDPGKFNLTRKDSTSFTNQGFSVYSFISSGAIMADKRQSARTMHRRRLEIARFVANHEAKRPRLESDSESDSLAVESGDSESEAAEVTDFGGEWDDEGSDPELYGERTTEVSGEETLETTDLEVDASDGDNVLSECDDVGSVSSDLGDESEASVSSTGDTSSVSSVCSDVDDVAVNSVPLFGDSQLNTHQFGVMFLSLAQRHNLTVASQNDILKFLHLTFPNPNRVPSSCYTLGNQFFMYKKETVVKHYCGNCLDLLAVGSSCVKEGCVHTMQPNAVFVQLQLHSQLKERFDDPEFADLLQYRFRRQNSSDTLADIYDGTEYKKYSDFFAHKYNVSFALNYDGAPKFKSSSMQIWPVQLYLNELPPQIRASREYLFLAGIWCSSKKPQTENFLSPLIDQLKLLASEGIKVNVNQEEVICKAKLLFTLADLPAKSALANCNQYNGAFGCLSCKHPGEQVHRGRGHARVYGYREISMRNHEEHLRHATEAEATRKATFGVKGMSIMHLLPNFDIIDNNPVDYMHCVLLGVVKQRLLPLWFDSIYHRNPWYIGNKVKEVDRMPIEFQAFMRNLKSAPSARWSPERLTYNASAVGASQHHKLEREEAAAVQKLVMIPADCSVVLHPKIILWNQLLFSRKATRVKKRNAYTVKYQDLDSDELHYGRIEKFISVYSPLAEVAALHIAIIRPLNVCPGLSEINFPEETLQLMPILYDNIFTILCERSQLVAVTLDKIVCKCFDVSTGTRAISYLLPIMNEKEKAL